MADAAEPVKGGKGPGCMPTGCAWGIFLFMGAAILEIPWWLTAHWHWPPVPRWGASIVVDLLVVLLAYGAWLDNQKKPAANGPEADAEEETPPAA